MRSPYAFVGGRLEVEGTGAKFSLSWDGTKWHEVGDGLDALFHSRTRATPATNTGSSASCRRGRGSSAWPSSTTCKWRRSPCPGWSSGRTASRYTDQSTGPRQVRLTHEWVERSLSRPPAAPPRAASSRPTAARRTAPTSSSSGGLRRSPRETASRTTTSSFPTARTWPGPCRPTSRSW